LCCVFRLGNHSPIYFGLLRYFGSMDRGISWWALTSTKMFRVVDRLGGESTSRGTMALSSARLALRRSLVVAPPRAASLGAEFGRATEETCLQWLTHRQLLPRLLSSDAPGSNKVPPPRHKSLFISSATSYVRNHSRRSRRITIRTFGSASLISWASHFLPFTRNYFIRYR
jgi:hypothetical protein